MKIIHHLNDLNLFSTPLFLTIGNFDGVHLGHQMILKELKKQALKGKAQSLVITFENDPKKVLGKTQESRLICTPAHKIKLLEELNLDGILLLQFTKEFSLQTAENFLSEIQKKIPFSRLILGDDALFGKSRLGTKTHIQEISKHLHFEAQYLKQLLNDEKPISSTRIRSLIEEGHLIEAAKLLGRKYSIYSKVIKGLAKGKELGFPTANLNVEELCLPPFGVYTVLVECENQSFKAVANLGTAPTVRSEKTVRLEIHLVEKNKNLYGKNLNVIFYDFIRPEKRFTTLEALKTQIQEDIEKTKIFKF